MSQIAPRNWPASFLAPQPFASPYKSLPCAVEKPSCEKPRFWNLAGRNMPFFFRHYRSSLKIVCAWSAIATAVKPLMQPSLPCNTTKDERL